MLPMLQNFMDKANTRILEQAVDKLRAEVQSLQHTLNTLQKRCDDNSGLRKINTELQGANKELRLANANLSKENEKILGESFAMLQDVKKLGTRLLEVETRQQTVEDVENLETRLVDVEARQQIVEDAFEQLAAPVKGT